MVGILMGLTLFFFGACVGSFLNVVVYRLNHGLSPLWGRSFCPKCKKKIPWQDHIPLLSFILLRGHCRFCHSPISIQYPLVELSTGVLTVITCHLLWSKSIFNFQFSIFNLLITYALIALFVSDLRYQTIPDEVVYPAIGLAIFYSTITNHQSPITNLFSGIGSAGFFLLLALVTRGKGMGMGDVKLAGLMGLVLGWPKIIVAFWLAFLTGAIAGVILILLRKKRFGEHIPFGPFLTTATWIALFWGSQIFERYLEIIINY